MPITFPRDVRNAWGEDIAKEVARVLDEHFEQRAVSRDEFREVLSRLDVLEERFDHMDKRFDRMEERFEKRFDQIDARFEQMDARFDAVNDRFDRLHEAMRVQTRWTVGTIALFAAIVTVLLAVAQFTA